MRELHGKPSLSLTLSIPRLCPSVLILIESEKGSRRG